MAVTCPLCESPVAPGDSFCESCGHPLTSPACESCGAAAVDAEGYCERCGVRQTTDRDHAETVLDNGAAAVTDRGLRRARNEDAVALLPLRSAPLPRAAASTQPMPVLPQDAPPSPADPGVEGPTVPAGAAPAGAGSGAAV
ncbi:zinc ribbon domain-containing protein, partial [Nonomuraea sp. MCN248]